MSMGVFLGRLALYSGGNFGNKKRQRMELAENVVLPSEEISDCQENISNV